MSELEERLKQLEKEMAALQKQFVKGMAELQKNMDMQPQLVAKAIVEGLKKSISQHPDV